MLIQRTKNRWGTEYLYFFCASKRDKKQSTCPTPHVNVLHVEELVEQHYATVRFDPGFAAEVRAASRLLHRQFTKELQALDVQENNLLDLSAGDLPGSAADKIKIKLHDIDRRRQHLAERLGTTNDELSVGAKLIETCLTLLADPQELYRRCDDRQRRLLNQALFQAFYIEDDQVSESDLKEPFAQLHALQQRQATTANDRREGTQNDCRAASRTGDDPAVLNGLQALLPGIDLARGCSKAPNVGLVGALSRPNRQVKRLWEISRNWTKYVPNWTFRPNPYRTMRRLQSSELDELEAAYRAGATTRQLADQFGIHRTTIGQHLRVRGIDTQPPGLKSDDVPTAAALYRAGWSLARLGDKFGTTDDTVRAHLLKAGVRMRGPHERT
jgi:hypothetical protein